MTAAGVDGAAGHPPSARRPGKAKRRPDTLENIGDIIDKNLMELARKKLDPGRRFSEAGEAELIEFHSRVSKNLERAIAGFAANDRSLAQEVLDQRPVVRQRERELRDSHLAARRSGNMRAM